MRGRDANERAGRPAALDWLVGAAGLLGGTLLLSSRRHTGPILADPQGTAEMDETAKAGRGRPQRPPSATAKRRGHEPLDADPGAIAWTMVGLAAVMIAAVLGMALVLLLFHSQLRTDRPTFTGEQSAHLEPPKPRLEAHPSVDLHNELTRENAALDNYGWRDAAHTRAHVPIRRAMALAVGRSLDPGSAGGAP